MSQELGEQENKFEWREGMLPSYFNGAVSSLCGSDKRKISIGTNKFAEALDYIKQHGEGKFKYDLGALEAMFFALEYREDQIRNNELYDEHFEKSPLWKKILKAFDGGDFASLRLREDSEIMKPIIKKHKAILERLCNFTEMIQYTFGIPFSIYQLGRKGQDMLKILNEREGKK